MQTILTILTWVAIAGLIIVLRIKNQELKQANEKADAYKTIAEHSESRYEELRDILDREAADEHIIQVAYCTSESDAIKYKTEKAMEKAISSRLAFLVGNDIQKWITPSILPLENGDKKYSFTCKIRRV